MTIPWKNSEATSGPPADLTNPDSVFIVETISLDEDYIPEYLNLHSSTISEQFSYEISTIEKQSKLLSRLQILINKKTLKKNCPTRLFTCILFRIESKRSTKQAEGPDSDINTNGSSFVATYYILNKNEKKVLGLKHENILLIKTSGKHRRLLLKDSFYAGEHCERQFRCDEFRVIAA